MTQSKTGNSRAPGIALRVALAALVVFTLVPASVLVGSKQAYAAVDIPAIGDVYTGSCYIENEWNVGDTTYFNVGNFTGELAGCWNIGNYHCTDPTAVAASYVWATYSARVVYVDVDAGYVEYYVSIAPPGASDGTSRDPSTGWLYGYQHVAANVRVAKDFGGFIELYKSSSNTEINTDNNCYSFEGGVFNVYDSGGAHVATLTTDNNGYAKTTERLKFGWYNVVEATPPKGYARDASDHWVEVSAGNGSVATVRVADKPQGNPVSVAVGKVDADTTLNLPQGDTTLAGAQFTVSYYDGYYTTEEEALASGSATRTWVLKTDANGEALLVESSLVDGSDALYHDSAGNPIIPLGTVIVKETEAPKDYMLPDPVPVDIIQVTSNTNTEHVTTYNAPQVADTVKRGDISLTKFYDDTPETDTGTMVPEPGITFDFYASRQFEGTTPKNGEAPAFSLTTDENGDADTGGLYLIDNGDGTYTNRPRKADDAGALPHDTYLMVQRNTAEGYEKVDPILIYVSENAKTYDYLLQNGAVQTPLRVVKIDAETGQTVPYPASWQIIDCATGEPVSMTTHYPTPEAFDVFTSDSQGRLTLPEKLPWGQYELKEVLAPADGTTGYLLNPANVTFTTEEGHDWDNPMTITCADTPAKGRIEINKADSTTGTPVAKATYVIQTVGDIYTLDGTLRVADGEIVDTITTDETGYAATGELYLGRYDVIEAISPTGFALDTKRWGVTLAYADQTVPVVTEGLEVSDVPTTLAIEKVDAETGKPMANVEFLITADEGDYAKTVTTDEAGRASLAYIPHGSYTITEVKTPSGYVSNDEDHHFTVDDQGLIEGHSIYSLVIENAPIQVKISKTDIATSEELPGCEMEIYRADEGGKATGEPLYAWVSTNEPYEITGSLNPGSYVLRERLAEEGYLVADDIVFKVADTGEIQMVTMEDDFTKLDISKKDIATDDELPGAHLSVYKVDEDGNRTGEALYEWISTDEPYLIKCLEPGDYLLVEDAAPAGYELARDVAFSVKETAEVQKVVIYDECIPGGEGYDKTGFDLMPLVVLGGLLAAGGLLGLGIGLKRHHRVHAEKDRETTIPKGEDMSGNDGLFKS